MRSGARLWLAVLSACTPGLGADDVGRIEQAMRVCADGATTPGIDISSYQGAVDWDAIAASGVKFAFLRAASGTQTTDEQFVRNWSEARRVGIIRGAYVYFRPNQSVTGQADIMLNMMPRLEADDLAPVLDIETDAGLPASEVLAKAREFVDYVEAELARRGTPRRLIVYTAFYFYRDTLGANAMFQEHPLWVANYGVTCPLTPPPWSRWHFWQTGDTGTVPGVSGPCDTDVFNGSIDELRAFLAAQAPPGGVDAGPVDSGAVGFDAGPVPGTDSGIDGVDAGGGATCVPACEGDLYVTTSCARVDCASFGGRCVTSPTGIAECRAAGVDGGFVPGADATPPPFGVDSGPGVVMERDDGGCAVSGAPATMWPLLVVSLWRRRR